jgi:hypothetical protein
LPQLPVRFRPRHQRVSDRIAPAAAPSGALVFPRHPRQASHRGGCNTPGNADIKRHDMLIDRDRRSMRIFSAVADPLRKRFTLTFVKGSNTMG